MITLLKRTDFGSFFHLEQYRELKLNIVESNQVENIDYGVVFRWGCRTRIRASGGTVNYSSQIGLASDKPQARRVMIEADVRVPATLYTLDQAMFWMIRNPRGILIGRPRSHSMGRHFHVIENFREVYESFKLGDKYWTEYIRKDYELRIFVFFGRVMGVARKTPREGMLDQISWNSEYASFRNVRWNEWDILACRLAVKATAALGLHFGAVDLIREESSGKYYILEINTSPGITSRYRIDSLARCIGWLKQHIDSSEGIPEILSLSEGDEFREIIHPAIMRN